MANSPRPGVIQLDHPNVYMAMKEAQKDDWLRRGINLTGDLAGEALTKRNQDIRYQRAAGDPEGYKRRTNGEVVGDLANGAWGLLKAPFTEDVVTEKSYEEGVKTEKPLFQGEMSQEDPFSGGMSREKTMSRAEPEPDDAVSVSFPTTIVGKDRVVEPTRREVGGKFDWDFPNKGYKTEFPTTVVGAPSALKAPSTQPVGQEAPEAPQNDAGATNDKVPEGMLRAPNWSEMFRLDPERAKYDWTRAHNTEVLAQKAEAAQARMELMQAKMEAKANAGSSLEELQQLWKENQRGLLQARKDQDNSSTKMYEDNIARLLPILQEKAPAVWGNPPGKGPGAKAPTPGDGEGAPKTPEQLRQDRQDAVKEGYAAVRAYMVDKDSNGVIDDPLALEQKLTEIRDKYGVSESDLADVRSAIEKAAKAMQENSQFKVGEGERRRSAAAQAFSQHKDFLPSVQTVKAIRADPSNQTNIQLGVSELLKILSGTGVSDSERMNTILSMTPTEYQNEIRSKSVQLGKSFIDTFLNMDAVALAEYSTKVDPKLLANVLRSRIPDESWEWAEKHSIGGDDNKPAPGGKGKVTISGWK